MVGYVPGAVVGRRAAIGGFRCQACRKPEAAKALNIRHRSTRSDTFDKVKSRPRALGSGECIIEAMAPSRGGHTRGARQWARDSTNGLLGHRHCAFYDIS